MENANQSPGQKGPSHTVLLVGVVVGVCLLLLWRARLGTVEQAEALPELEVAGWLNTEGPPNREALQGRVVLVDCWATWCGPCRAAMPDLVDFHQRFADQPVQVIGLTPEGGSEQGTVEGYVASVDGLDWPIGYGAGPTLAALGTEYFPSYYVFDRQGQLIEYSNHLDEAEGAVVEALAK